MKLKFLNREEERERFNRRVCGAEGTFVCLYGRRRCGKSRLLSEVLKECPAVYYVGDDREAALQRSSLAAAIAELVEGFDRVDYPDWEVLLERWWSEAPAQAVLALDEFPSMVASSPELPGLLQKRLDKSRGEPLHTVICGSSQRMMQGFVLDSKAPLYGRSHEILNIRPLGLYWLRKAFKLRKSLDVINAYALWGGVPRYWELALDFEDVFQAAQDLVLDPMGVLHDEPERLLLDDLREVTQAASLLALIGQGCHRVSELAARLGKPATALSRPLARLLELGFINREQPFGANVRTGKRSLYVIADPFLRFWFRYIEPNRSRLQAGQCVLVMREMKQSWAAHIGNTWEMLAREAVPRMQIDGQYWNIAARWWGGGLDRRPLEVDILAESVDRQCLLVGEAKLRIGKKDIPSLENRLADVVQRLPVAQGKTIIPCVFALESSIEKAYAGMNIITGKEVIEVLR